MKNVLKDKIKLFLLKKIFKCVERPIVCFDSDDWGVKKISDNLFLPENYGLFSQPFVFYDSLEKEEELIAIRKLLLKYYDSYGNHPVFTLNYAAFNPDYNKIYLENFKKYYKHTIIDTFGDEKWNSIKKIINCNRNIFDVSFHCAQHINIFKYLQDGQNGNNSVLTACRMESTNIASSYINNKAGYMDELSTISKKEAKFVYEQLIEGQKFLISEFEHMDFRTITPSCGVLDKNIFAINRKKYKFRYAKISLKHYLSVKRNIKQHVSIFGKFYGVKLIYRCIDFDPCLVNDIDEYVNSSICEIDFYIKHKIPVIISTHRINYVRGHDGGIHVSKSLEALDKILNYLVGKYKDIEFISTKDCIRRYRK